MPVDSRASRCSSAACGLARCCCAATSPNCAGRERELITKDATIREIHHRVKNNLQTVAALLRLQSRRVQAPEAKEALAEAMRRVSTIALVHETLSGTLDELVNFDDLAARSMRMAADVASPGVQVQIVREGDFGLVPAQYASSLALVITELVTNAVEHGFDGKERGTITVTAQRDGDLVSRRRSPTTGWA